MDDPKKPKRPFFTIRSERPQKAEWIMLCFTTVLCFFFFSQYMDLRCTNQHGMALIYSICEGRFGEFYKICADKAIIPAFYNIIIYVIFAAWNLPLAIYFKITTGRFDFTSEIQIFAGWYWAKLLLVIIAVVTAYLMYKVAREIGMNANKSRWVAYVFLASPVILFILGCMGQYDIIMLALFLLALIYYIQNKPYRFALIMALAIPCKLFALFAFIPLVLFMEKRVIHIIKFIAIGVSVYLVTTLPFIFMPGHTEATAYMATYGFKDKIIQNGIASGFGHLSIFAFAMVSACVYAYKTKIETPKQRWQYAIYTPLFTMGLMLAFITWHPQWWVIIVPFLLLCAFTYEDFKTSMFCVLGFSIFFLITTVTYFVNNVDLDMLNHGLIFQWLGYRYSNTLSYQSLFTKLGIHYPNFYDAFMVAFLFVLLFLFFPGRGKLLFPNKPFYPPKSVIYAYHLSLYLYLGPAALIILWKLIASHV